MELHECHLDKDREEKFDYIDIRPISDAHIGDPYFKDDLLQKDIDWIKEKDNRFTLLNGDILNTATTHSVSDTYENTMTPHQELKYARELFKPIKDKVLCATQGNHEKRISRNDGVDLAEELAISLDTFYKKEGLTLKVKFGKRKSNQKPQVYTIYVSHGFTGSRLVGGKANRLAKLQKIVTTDCYIVGHSHQKISFSQSIFYPDLRNNKMTQKKQTFINIGAYLEWDGYAQEKAYTPSDLGTVTLRLYGGEKKTEVIS